MITTRESINYQFSLIFGYSSPNDLIAGDVIGPGRLTREKINELSQEVIKYLAMYNAILRDYTGAEVFSIEFDLYNLDEKAAKTQIFPKSMIFIPGEFKECESLLLALKPETGYLDVHKSNKSMNNISKLFYEVEEFADRPDLSNINKQIFYNKFASRFSKKLFGDLIEDKWNKKLIGLSTSLPTEKEMLNTYARIISDVEILRYKKPIEINLLNSRYEKVKMPFEGQEALEHLKYSISEPSANFIVDKTLNLGSSLINLANMGTLDEYQDVLVKYIIRNIRYEIDVSKEPQTGEWLISRTSRILLALESYLNKFMEYSYDFLASGEMGNLSLLLENYTLFITNKGNLENEDFKEICEIIIKFINQSVIQKENLRISELKSVFNYFSEIVKRSLDMIRRAFPAYLSRRRLRTLTIELIENLKIQFNKEQKPAKILGLNLIQKFTDHLFNLIEVQSITLSKTFDEKKVIVEFRNLVNNNIDTFFDTIRLKIEDLVSFAEIQIDQDVNLIKFHLDKFKKFSSELNYLLSYILRHSTINRFIKDEFGSDIQDPISFANKFYRFLEKRIGGINLEWKSYVLEWINDYSKRFLKIEERRDWTLTEIYTNFLEYFEDRENNEQKLNKFLEFLDNYIAGISDAEEKGKLVDFYKQYELSLGINEEFPKYVKSKIKEATGRIEFQIEQGVPINFFSINNNDTYYEYMENIFLKYFSKLIPRPLSLILKHNLTNEEKELFKGDLFHVIDFKFWHNNVRFELSDNFKEVYREWMK
ncbi:MAG: hypothetical protein KGD65_01905 [Candidatus Lokiarchaeota archaeon]|nr:hypothetical protein [Candidatus Lokiarchaeota archaeon]